ncbi:MAG: DUF1549 domain-containing protein [Acidobacteriota bacterium]
MLGMTVQCARCHDHKFDPITQKDYYALEASIFGYVETDYPLGPREQADAYMRKLSEIGAKVEALKDQIDEIEKALSREGCVGVDSREVSTGRDSRDREA